MPKQCVSFLNLGRVSVTLYSMRILGVDPGSRLTGYGCIDWISNRAQVVTHGTLKLSNTNGKATIPLEVRLLSIYHGLSDVIQEVKPEVLVIEKVFFAKNAVSALKLGQARGAAILTGMIHSLKIFEYSPTEVKQSIVGNGHADKDQVAKMLELLVGKQSFDTSDASDGLALAVCHAHFMRQVSFGNQRKNTSAQVLAEALRTSARGRKKSGSSLADAIGIDAQQTLGKRRISSDKLR